MKKEKFDVTQPKEVKKMLATRDKKLKEIVMTAFAAIGVEDIKDVTEETTSDGHCKSFIFQGKVFLVVSSRFERGEIQFDIKATKLVLVALKVKKLIS